MINFIIGLIIGAIIGVIIMCSLILIKEKEN
jgi:hypothetical protein